MKHGTLSKPPDVRSGFEVARVWVTTIAPGELEFHVALRALPGNNFEPYGHLLFECAYKLADELSKRLSVDLEKVLELLLDTAILELTENEL